MDEQSFEDYCRHLIEAGRKIFPVRYKDKAPLKVGWHDCVTQSDDEMLAEMLNAYAKSEGKVNVGMCVGAVSNTLTFDLDFKHPEAEDFWEEHKTDLSTALIVNTGNGKHCHYKHPGITVLSEIGQLAKGVDLLCDTREGSNPRYVLIPPSVHPNGTSYSYADDNRTLEGEEQW